MSATSTNSQLLPDGKFRKVGATDIEVALSRNGRQVCIRNGQEPQKSVITSSEAWTDFLDGVRSGKLNR